MKRLLSALAILSAMPSFAINSSDWNGTVLDENGEGLPYANVALLSKADSSVICGATTDSLGKSELKTDSNDGIIMIAMLGYRTEYLKPESNMSIALVPDASILQGASVNAVMPKTVLGAEGLQTNVRGSMLENSGSANDVLGKVPGIIKGKDGIEVIGKGSPVIYVNGHKVSDSGELDRILSSEIQSVEVINNPGVQYSAEVRAVVKIRTVKRQGDGFGFNLALDDEQSLREALNDFSGKFNFNYRFRNLDIFAGAQYTDGNSSQTGGIIQESFGTKHYIQDGDLSGKYNVKNYAVNGGANYQINDFNFVGFKVEYNNTPKIDGESRFRESLIGDGTKIDSILSITRSVNGKINPFYISGNAYYNGRAGKLGIDLNVDYFGNESTELSNVTEKSYMLEDGKIHYETLSHNNMIAAKLVLSYPVWKGSLQIGTEDIFTTRKNEYSIAGAQIPASKSDVKETGLAGFANYSVYFPKVGQFSAGLRFEHNDFKYNDLLGGKNDLRRIYNNVFPSFSYAGMIGKVQTMVNVSSKTLRPSFDWLSEAISYGSRYVIQSGNAKLQPQMYTDASITAVWKIFTGVINYSRTDKAITQWSSPYNDEGMVLVKPENMDNPVRKASIFLVATPTAGVWSLNLTAGLMQQWFKIKEKDFSDKPMAFVKMTNSFKLKKDWQLELGSEYHSKSYQMNMFITNNYLDLTAAIQKSLLKDKSLVLRLEGFDLAGLANYDVYAYFGKHTITQNNIFNSQKVRLSIKYKFNSAQSKYRGTGAGKETASRIK